MYLLVLNVTQSEQMLKCFYFPPCLPIAFCYLIVLIESIQLIKLNSFDNFRTFWNWTILSSLNIQYLSFSILIVFF